MMKKKINKLKTDERKDLTLTGLESAEDDEF